MATTGDFLGPLKELGYSAITWIIIVIIGIIILVGLGFLGRYFYKKKKWNLRVEVKLPRSDGKIIGSEKAKGYFNAREGIVDIKRKGMKVVGTKPFDVRKYLQGTNYLEVIQIGPEEYIPILPKSYTKITNEKDGKIKALLEIEADLGKQRTWKTYFERVAKDRFTLSGFLDKHWRAIEMGILFFVIFLGFAIIWMRMPSICG